MSEPSSNRNLNIEGNVKGSVIIVGDSNCFSGLKGYGPPSAQSDNMSNSSLPKKLDPLARLKLIQTLNSLPSAQFDEIVFALNPPHGTMPSNFSSQGSRSQVLLAWLESSTGPGMSGLEAVLESIFSVHSHVKQPGGESQGDGQI
ncbi:MAG: hypothetical protein AAFZ17_14565 [Cyanobacteria bacterium J06650_10]